HAQSSSYAGASLEIPIGSRSLALGGAYVGLANDESAFHWNPAGVSLLQHKALGMMYASEYGAPANGLADLWHFGFTLPMKNLSFAVNWVRLDVPKNEHTQDYT